MNRPVPPGYKKNKNDPFDPSTVRALTAKERSYIQTFPKSFDLTPESSKTNLEQMIGNAVPVNLAYHVGKVVLDYFEGGKNQPEYVQTSINLIMPQGRSSVKVSKAKIEMLLSEEMSKIQIAKKLCISRSTLYRLLNS